MRTYTGEQNEIWKKQFSRVLSRDRYWENKTYKQKRSVVGFPSMCTDPPPLKKKMIFPERRAGLYTG